MINKEKVTMSEDSLLAFLSQIEASFAHAFLDSTKEDKSILDVSVKGFEHLSLDWALALSEYYHIGFFCCFC